MTAQMTLSAFVQTPTRGLVPLDAGDDVVLTRRDGVDLRIRREDDVRALEGSVGHAVNVIARLAPTEATQRVVAALTDEFPWMTFLSERETAAFATEYLTTLRASAAIAQYARVDVVVNAWRATAELKADPERSARIQRRLHDEELIVANRPRRVSAKK